MEIKEIRKLLDDVKWYHHIPVIGPMIYSMRFEMKLIDLQKHERKALKFYRSIFNLISMIIGLGFLIATLLLRDKHGFGHWPWIFWVGLGIGLSQNLTFYLSKFLYLKGFKRLDQINIENLKKENDNEKNNNNRV